MRQRAIGPFLASGPARRPLATFTALLTLVLLAGLGWGLAGGPASAAPTDAPGLPPALPTSPPTPLVSPTATPTNTPTPLPTSTLPGPQPSAVTTALPTPVICTLVFNDVPIGQPFYAWIRCLACQGIISGYGCGGAGEECPGLYFRPGNHVTRAQVAKIVANSAGLNDPLLPDQQTFADVPPTYPFWIWIERNAVRGIINGYTCGGPGEPCDGQNRAYFRPGNDVTRGQFAKLVSLAVGFNDPIESTKQTFSDVPTTHPFWLFAERVALHGIISGYACGSPGEPCDPATRPYLRPGNSSTRAQSAKITANTFSPVCNPAGRPARK